MLTKKTQYAFKALMYMAEKKQNTPVVITEISKKKKIPRKFLEVILLELKTAGILNSKKGKGGGYWLAVLPQTVMLSTIMRLIDGPIALLPCVSLNFYEKCKNCDEKNCGLKNVMSQVRDASLAILEHKTLADISNLQ
jgi:Rrf2 family protein